MITETLLKWEEAVRILESQSCKPVEQSVANVTIWETEWGFAFSIPHLGPDKLVPRFTLLNILDEVKKTKPKKPS